SSMAKTIWYECYREILSCEQIYYMLSKYLSVNVLSAQIRYENYHYYILQIDGKNAGYLGIHAEKDRLFLSKLYILKSFRGEKIPTKVIYFLDDFCRKNNLEKIYLTVNKYNTHAYQVYEHLGFHQTDTAVTDIGNGYVMDDFIMERTVNEGVDEKFMRRALTLAQKGKGSTYPNPMVGAVIVYQGQIICEGYHHKAGEPHAEVNAINSLKDNSLLPKSTIYVTLEPCSHWGKTPPCADLILEKKIPRVVIGIKDPFSEVNGQGISKLKGAGVEVKVGVLGKECAELNERFFTFHTHKRPFVILKWAQTSDGFIDKLRTDAGVLPEKISGDKAQKMLHKWRSEEMAIIVGTQTAFLDNPRLDARLSESGKNPLRVILDVNNRIPNNYHVKDGAIPTLIFASENEPNTENVSYVHVEKNEKVSPEFILTTLYSAGIQSVIVEGGEKLISSFISTGLWDEMRVFVSENELKSGVKAPVMHGLLKQKVAVGEDTLLVFQNKK
ncbi:MAG: bifunctional diaminohydroxyphosphoribosylaminopyrimidine deaminase/5-amino-6-(5-phosphoribosylamino)uracil reductase RibD, partial [Flavobacteriales bacterium]|nr:bifunctional diaminohydroxyphosphoribosylaminopyrimidine deaminase/5-amino-6-(5-phosphoribosylamino)uracil reductase RibD [Flavobacteriales bacterium]